MRRRTRWTLAAVGAARIVALAWEVHTPGRIDWEPAPLPGCAAMKAEGLVLQEEDADTVWASRGSGYLPEPRRWAVRARRQPAASGRRGLGRVPAEPAERLRLSGAARGGRPAPRPAARVRGRRRLPPRPGGGDAGARPHPAVLRPRQGARRHEPHRRRRSRQRAVRRVLGRPGGAHHPHLGGHERRARVARGVRASRGASAPRARRGVGPLRQAALGDDRRHRRRVADRVLTGPRGALRVDSARTTSASARAASSSRRTRCCGRRTPRTTTSSGGRAPRGSCGRWPTCRRSRSTPSGSTRGSAWWAQSAWDAAALLVHDDGSTRAIARFAPVIAPGHPIPGVRLARGDREHGPWIYFNPLRTREEEAAIYRVARADVESCAPPPPPWTHRPAP